MEQIREKTTMLEYDWIWKKNEFEEVFEKLKVYGNIHCIKKFFFQYRKQTDIS